MDILDQRQADRVGVAQPLLDQARDGVEGDKLAGEVAPLADKNLEASVRKRANCQRREQTFFADAGGELLDIRVVLAGVEGLSDIQGSNNKPRHRNRRDVHLGPPSLDGPLEYQVENAGLSISMALVNGRCSPSQT